MGNGAEWTKNHAHAEPKIVPSRFACTKEQKMWSVLKVGSIAHSVLLMLNKNKDSSEDLCPQKLLSLCINLTFPWHKSSQAYCIKESRILDNQWSKWPWSNPSFEIVFETTLLCSIKDGDCGFMIMVRLRFVMFSFKHFLFWFCWGGAELEATSGASFIPQPVMGHVVVSWGCHNKVLHTEIYCLTFMKAKVWDQSGGRFVSFWELWGKDLFQASLLVLVVCWQSSLFLDLKKHHLISAFFFTGILCVCVGGVSVATFAFYKDTSPLKLVPSLIISF